MNLRIAIFGLIMFLLGAAGFYGYKVVRSDITNQFNVSNDKIAKDLEGRTVSLPYGQIWPFEPAQGITTTVVSKKQIDDYVMVVVDVKATADVAPSTETKPAPPGIKTLKVGLNGLAKLTYEKVNNDWFIVSIDPLSLSAYPLVNGQ